MSEKRPRPKSTKEKDLKIVGIQIVGKRTAFDADLKPISAWFYCEGRFEIDSNKRFKNFTMIKIFRAQKFTWDSDFHMVTKVLLTDGFTTFIITPTQELPYGVELSVTTPKRITEKEAIELINQKGAYVVKLGSEDTLQTLAVARF